MHNLNNIEEFEPASQVVFYRSQGTRAILVSFSSSQDKKKRCGWEKNQTISFFTMLFVHLIFKLRTSFSQSVLMTSVYDDFFPSIKKKKKADLCVAKFSVLIYFSGKPVITVSFKKVIRISWKKKWNVRILSDQISLWL